MGFNSGPVGMRKSGGSLLFYTEASVTTLYAAVTFGTNANSVTITNDSATDTISLSWDAATLIADLKPGETLEISTRTRTTITMSVVQREEERQGYGQHEKATYSSHWFYSQPPFTPPRSL